MDRIIFLNKAKGISSASALNQMKKKFNISSLGHAGTLDPFATGMLIAASGRATKLLSYFQSLPKEYIAKVRLGIQTNTDDCTGEIVASSSHKVPLEETLPGILDGFRGEIEQVPPIFSALKVNGKRAYALARQNISPNLLPRMVHIDELEVLDINTEEQTFCLKIKCSKGTYIRALARDIGRALGSLGTLWELERAAIGAYSLNQAVKLEEMQEVHFHRVEDIFSHYPSIKLREEYLKIVLNGARILPPYLFLSGSGGAEGYIPSYYRLYSLREEFLGIVENSSSHFVYRTL